MPQRIPVRIHMSVRRQYRPAAVAIETSHCKHELAFFGTEGKERSAREVELRLYCDNERDVCMAEHAERILDMEMGPYHLCSFHATCGASSFLPSPSCTMMLAAHTYIPWCWWRSDDLVPPPEDTTGARHPSLRMRTIDIGINVCSCMPTSTTATHHR